MTTITSSIPSTAEITEEVRKSLGFLKARIEGSG